MARASSRRSGRKSRFKGSVSRNVARQQQGRGAAHLQLPKGVGLFKEEAKTRVNLDFIPYVVTDKNHPDRDEEFQIAVPGEVWYKRPYRLHRDIGPNKDRVVCLASVGQKCPICDYRQELLDDGADWNDDAVKALRATQRNLYVVIPRGHRNYDETFHIWDVSQFLFQDALNEEIEENEEYETFPDPVEGYTVQIRFSEEKIGKNTYAKVSRIDFTDRKTEMNDDIIDQAPNLDEVLVIPTPETVEQLFYGGLGASDGGNDDDEDTGDEPDDDGHEDDVDSDDYQDDEEETTRPARGQTRRRRQSAEEMEDDYDPDDVPFATGDQSEDDTGDEEDQPEPPPTTPQRSRTRTNRQTIGECPSGHTFGEDVDQHPDCDNCPIWEKCMDAYEKMQG